MKSFLKSNIEVVLSVFIAVGLFSLPVDSSFKQEVKKIEVNKIAVM